MKFLFKNIRAANQPIVVKIWQRFVHFSRASHFIETVINLIAFSSHNLSENLFLRRRKRERKCVR